MASGLAVHTLQMLALLGLMSVKWPGSFEATSPRLQFLLLDMEDLRLSCPLGRRPVTKYLVTVSAFPVALLWLALCHALSKCCCFQRVKAWKLAFTLNTMGLGLQLGFGAISTVALKPTMCYQHPNGRESLASYPSIFCGESGHVTMLCCGVVLLVVFVLGFLVLCAHAIWNLPSWSVQGHYHKVQSFRFFTSNFRFDAYWFILPQLLKSLGFALSATLGTQYPPAQTGLATMVLMLYMTLQAVVHPWKAPVINVADTILNALLLLAATKSIPTDVNIDIEADFANYFMIVILLFPSCNDLGQKCSTLSQHIHKFRHFPSSPCCLGSLIPKLMHLFPPIAFTVGVLTSSVGAGDRGISRFVAGGVQYHLGCHWWCLITDVARRCRAWCRLGVFLVVSDRSRNGVGGVAEGVGVSLVVVRSPECRWWCLIVCVGGGVLLAGVAGRCRGGCCVGCRGWCSIGDLGGRCCAARWLGMFLVG